MIITKAEFYRIESVRHLIETTQPKYINFQWVTDTLSEIIESVRGREERKMTQRGKRTKMEGAEE